MKIVLATGIYPPDIGGPATYCRQLAREFFALHQDVTVITYGDRRGDSISRDGFRLVVVPKSIPLFRWFLYAKALRSVAQDADILYAFSSVSCGVPLRLARLKRPKKLLRLGGDFFWERYTDHGGKLGLRAWYAAKKKKCLRPLHGWMQSHLRTFDHLVFSSDFQYRIYAQYYKALPDHTVIDNVVPVCQPILHVAHSPFRLLFVGRFVRFKNLIALLHALRDLSDATLTLTGDGPMRAEIMHTISALALEARVTLLPPVHGEEKKSLFLSHDLLVLPSLTDISPNVALEARASGLPVLLTRETGLRASLTSGMLLVEIFHPRAILTAVRSIMASYPSLASLAASPPFSRDFSTLTDEHLSLFRRLL